MAAIGKPREITFVRDLSPYSSEFRLRWGSGEFISRVRGDPLEVLVATSFLFVLVWMAAFLSVVTFLSSNV